MYAERNGHLPILRMLVEHEGDMFHKQKWVMPGGWYIHCTSGALAPLAGKSTSASVACYYTLHQFSHDHHQTSTTLIDWSLLKDFITCDIRPLKSYLGNFTSVTTIG